MLEPDGDVDLAGLGERIVTRVKVLAILNYSCLWFCKGGRGMCRIVRNQGPFMRLVEIEFGGPIERTWWRKVVGICPQDNMSQVQ